MSVGAYPRRLPPPYRAMRAAGRTFAEIAATLNAESVPDTPGRQSI